MNAKTGPLQGVRILDLTRATAGPFASMMLADIGAEVIKIENPPDSGGMASRSKLDTDYLIGADDPHFMAFNRNKKSIVLDLRRSEGKALFYDLVKVSDVVFDNFRPGVLERLKIDHESLRAVNPRIISCSNSGFGQDGPRSQNPAFDIIILGLTGMLDAFNLREPDGRLAQFPIPLADHLGGMWSAFGIAAALYAAYKTGVGQRIDISMLDGTISLLGWLAAYPLNFGIERNTAAIHLYGSFMTKDGYIIVAAHRENFWGNFCKALGKPELAGDERYNTVSKRINKYQELRVYVEEILAGKGKEEWLRILQEYDVPSGPIYSLKDALNDPQLLHRQMIATMTKEGKTVRVLGNPVKVSDLEEQRYHYPPGYGEHSEVILRDVLHYSQEQIGALRRAKIIYV